MKHIEPVVYHVKRTNVRLILQITLILALLASLGLVAYIAWLVNESRYPAVEYAEERVTATPSLACAGEWIEFTAHTTIRRAPSVPLIGERWYNTQTRRFYPGAILVNPTQDAIETTITVVTQVPRELPPGPYELRRATINGRPDILVVEVVVGDCRVVP
jgi:hypothetical protein